MDKKLLASGIAAAVCLGVYHFVKNPAVRTAAMGALGTIVALQIPIVQDGFAPGSAIASAAG